MKTKAIQKQLRIICKHLNLYNISTHSFRKLYATTQFEKSNNNLELVKELLNHSSVATTQRYIRGNSASY
ncbi:integrase [Clostridioides difficile]|nr:integrase [Clostridioides difficile]